MMTPATTHRSQTTDEYRRIYEAIKRFIDNNLATSQLSMDQFFATKAGRQVSRRSAQRALAWNGTSWRSMLLNARMQRASALIRETPDMYISSVAKMVGYKQPSNFSKLFKQKTGLSPSQYAEEVRRGR